MKNLNFAKKLFVIAFILIVPVIISCAGTSQRLASHSAQNVNLIQGTYTVVLYGGIFFDDPETFVFFDQEKDDFSIIPYGQKYLYKTVKGLNGQDAFQIAHKFFRSVLHAYNHYEIKQIFGPDGGTIGYEILPNLHSVGNGARAFLDISYWLQADKKVMVSISKIDPLGVLLFRGLDD